MCGADIQQRTVQERAAPGAGKLDAVADLGGVAAQPAAGAGDRAGAGAAGRRAAAVHGHRPHHLPRLPRLCRREAQDVPPVKDHHHIARLIINPSTGQEQLISSVRTVRQGFALNCTPPSKSTRMRAYIKDR